MLVGGGVLLFFLALHKVPGGWAAMQAANPDRFHIYRPPSDPTAPFLGIVLATFGVFIFYSAGNQVMAQRILAARSMWDGLMGVLWAGVINLLRPLVTCFLGLIVYHWINVMHMPLRRCKIPTRHSRSRCGTWHPTGGCVASSWPAFSRRSCPRPARWPIRQRPFSASMSINEYSTPQRTTRGWCELAGVRRSRPWALPHSWPRRSRIWAVCSVISKTA